MNKVVTILLLGVLALGAGTIHVWRQRTADHERVATLHGNLASATAAARVTASSRAMEVPITRTDESTASAVAAAPEHRVEVPSKVQVRAADSRTMLASTLLATSTPETTAMLASPEMLERVRAQARARAPSRFPDVGQVLGLSPEELNRLYDLLAQHEANDVLSLAADSTGEETRSQAQVRRAQANEAELASMLGSKYSQWKGYLGELPSRIQVRDLSAVLKASGTELSDSQAGSLVPALVSAQKRVWQMGGPVFSPENRQALVDAASSYLTPEQLEAYRQMLDRQQRGLDRSPTASLFGVPTPSITYPDNLGNAPDSNRD